MPSENVVRTYRLRRGVSEAGQLTSLWQPPQRNIAPR
jgi:hypothetical protein